MLDHVKGLLQWQELKAYIISEIASNVVELKVLLRQKSLSIEIPRCKTIKSALEELKDQFFSYQTFI